MRVRLSDPEQIPQLARFLRGSACLCIERNPLELEVHLLNHISARYDRLHVLTVLDDWRAAHPGTTVEPID